VRSPQALALRVLAINAGSSSLKFGLFAVGPRGIESLFSGSAAAIGEAQSVFAVCDGQGNGLCREARAITSQQDALARLAKYIKDADVPAPEAIGHRVVHGGPKLLRHCRIDQAVIGDLNAAVEFAPLHVPSALAAIRFCEREFAGVPQVACFDTAFHRALPDVARVLPIARKFEAGGLRRYGFHGLSCESILRRLERPLPRRIVIAHLGSGASVTAVRDGHSIDTSMGLTPTGGVVMSTRSGDLDPGVLVYLLREKRVDAEGLEDIVDRRSGLMGISARSGDMRVLRQAASSDPAARLAIDIFCASIRKQIAAMAAPLEGLDLLVFTGGIGENDPQSRAEICGGLGWMGVALDDRRNGCAENPISDHASAAMALVLPSEEDEQIARNSWRVLQEG